MAALCGCQSAHLAPLSPINRAYNREAGSFSLGGERASTVEIRRVVSGGRSVTWMIASLCFPARITPLPLPLSPHEILLASRARFD